MPVWVIRHLIVLFISPQIPWQIDALRHRFPTRTALMAQRLREAGGALEIQYDPVRLSQVPRLLQRAVVLAEDSAFFQHGGLDLRQIREAMLVNIAHGRIVRGASTLTQQLAKNLFLRPDRSVRRKLQEALIALYMERRLSKKRILELYLNVIEWGPGVFGIDPAARWHFRCTARELDAEEIALLVAAIPSPRRWTPRNPSPWLTARSNQILGMLEKDGSLEPGSVGW